MIVKGAEWDGGPGAGVQPATPRGGGTQGRGRKDSKSRSKRRSPDRERNSEPERTGGKTEPERS